MLLALTISLIHCRTEDLSEKEAATNHSNTPGQFTSRKISPSEFQKVTGLNDQFAKSENLLSQRISTGKNMMEGAVIDSSFVLETTNGVITSYTFPVYRQNQGKYFENLVLQKNNAKQQNFRSYLYKYQRKNITGYDPQNIEIYDLNTTTSNTSGKLLYIQNISQNGCLQTTVNSIDCGEGGHHTNGSWCPILAINMPYNTVNTVYTCNSSGDLPGGNNSGGNPPQGGGGGGGGGIPPIITSPIIKYPKWGICSEKTGTHGNILDLNPNQLAFINASAQNALRGEMAGFLVNNEAFAFDCNAPKIISPDVKSVGLWIINYAMTNPEFMNSEFMNKFINSDIQFQQWAINFLNQNQDVSWPQFESWFLIKSEGSDGEVIDNIDDILNSLQYQTKQMPTYSQFVSAFPKLDYQGYPGYFKQMPASQVYPLVGGNLENLYNNEGKDTGPYRNACTVRWSLAMNNSGILIPNNKLSRRGADVNGQQRHYLLKAISAGDFMQKTFGNPTHKLEGVDANDLTKVASFLKGKTGIYVIVNNDQRSKDQGGPGYSGHVDLIQNGHIPGGANASDVIGGIKSIRIWEFKP